MAREHKGYTISDNGIVASPGKFQGEPWYAIDIYEWFLEGDGEQIGDSSIFPVDDVERRTFGLDQTAYAVTLDTDEAGFVYVGTLSRNAYDDVIAEWETEDHE